MSKSVPEDSLGLSTPCPDRAHLLRWLDQHLRIQVPTRAVCPGHDAPYDYIHHAYFEPSSDVVVWAPRGGGKTRLAAAATLLDLLHKPGCQVRILGGSLEQSLRMWEHLVPDLEDLCADEIAGKIMARRVRLKNGSAAAALSQSQRAVRGLRVQKLRCDEVEMFDADVWEAAKLVTRSRKPGTRARQTTSIESTGELLTPSGRPITGTIEAISTLHKPYGLMQSIVDHAATTGTRVIRWCLMEVLEACELDRECPSCPLEPECHGIARTQCSGFISIDDAIAMKKRTSVETWDAEMLCRRPARHRCVFRTFDKDTHVREALPSRGAYCQLPSANCQLSLAIDFGYANPFVCLWIASDDGGRVHVIDEYVQEQRTLEEHVEHIRSRPWGEVPRIACDPAGAGRNDQTAQSNIDLLRRAGYQVFTRRSQIVEGLEMVRCALRPAHGEVRLFIHPRCKRLIQAMESYHYAPGGSELPVKDNTHDHLIDALRYYYVNKLWEPPTRRWRKY